MRFRRHVPQRPDWVRWLMGLLPRKGRAAEPASPDSVKAANLSADTEPPVVTVSSDTVLSADQRELETSLQGTQEPAPVWTRFGSRAIDRLGKLFPDVAPHDAATDVPIRWKRELTKEQRRILYAITGFGSAFLLGYLVAVFVLFPAPIFATTRAVPKLIGLAQNVAEERLACDRFVLGDVERIAHPSAPPGQVVWQDPPAGVGIPEGSMVRLSVSGGPQRVPVPDLLGYDASIARRLLEAAGLQTGRIDSTQAPVPRGVVVTTRPATGTTILPGSQVILVVSVGAPTIRVPDLNGLTLDEAEVVLQQVGLMLGTTLRKASASVPPGTIIEQTPSPGTLSAPGTLVNIFLARLPSR